MAGPERPESFPGLLPLVKLLDEPPRVELTGNERLINQFRHHLFYPIVVEGYEGKNSLLASLASSEASSFAQTEDDPDGVYMWPQPVLLGEVAVLLLKLRRSANADADYAEMKRRVKAGWMALASIWCICAEDRWDTFDAMKSFAQDYAEIRRQCYVKISKVFVFAKKDWFKRPDCQAKLDNILRALPNIFEIRYRGEEGSDEDRQFLSEFVAEVSTEACHAAYLNTHVDAFAGDFHERFVILLSAFAIAANLGMNFHKFVSKIPNIRDSDEKIIQHLQELEQLAESAALMKSRGKAIKLVAKLKENDDVVSTFDENVRELRDSYILSEETVVLSVMGPPGCGKNTLLNHIIQHCMEMPQTPSVFKTGNTGNHTTRGSWVCSHPLPLGKAQLMLIDLEGLGGAETGDLDAVVTPKRLVKAIMKVSSVLAIIVTNKETELAQVKRAIAFFAKLQSESGYVTERVYLLFHDQERNAKINIYFKVAVHELNNDIFGGREVVKLLNKPNFPAVSEEIRSEFLQTFLCGCLFPKRFHKLDIAVSIDALLVELSVLAQHELSDLTPEQSAQCGTFMQEKCALVRKPSSEIRSEDDTHLVCYFERSLVSQFAPALRAELEEMPYEMSLRCSEGIKKELAYIKNKLGNLERCYALIKAFPEEYILNMMNEWIYYQYSSTWSIFTFRDRLKELDTKLNELESYFPDRKVLHSVKQKFWRTKVLTFLQYAVWSILNTVLFIDVPDITTSITVKSSALVCAKADFLLSIDTMQVNSAVLQLLQEHPYQPAPVWLCIGSEATFPADFASKFVRYVSPFTPTDFDAFDKNKDTQIISLDYIHPIVGVCRAYLICLCMEEELTSLKARVMLKTAETLLPAASLICILSDRPNTYVNPLVHSLSALQFPRRKLILRHSQEESMESCAQMLWRVTIRYQLKLSVSMEEVKTEFDAVEARTAHVLLERLEALPQILAS